MPSRASGFIVWNRRLHYFIGLYLLFFSWLFAFTGLLLNHPKWTFAEFWPSRTRSTAVHEVRPPAGTGDAERARDLARQLELTGEIQLPARQPSDGQFVFQVNRPGHLVDVNFASATGRVTLQRTDLNVWGVMNQLHTFTGVRNGDGVNDRDWVLTWIWAFSMDAVALGLVVMVLSSYVMWSRLEAKRRGGLIALALGWTTCAAAVFGARWLLG